MIFFFILSSDAHNMYSKLRVVLSMMSYTGWPRKNATLTINNFKKTRGDEKAACIDAYRILFPAKWHQDHSFWGKRFDSMAVFLRQCHFQTLPLLSQSHNWRTENFHCWLPRVSVCSCFENEDSMNKRSIHYVTLPCYNPGEATQRNSSRPQSCLLIEKKQLFENDIGSEKLL